LAIAEAVFAPGGRRRDALWRHLERRLGALG
jgi:hypothetical protein